MSVLIQVSDGHYRRAQDVLGVELVPLGSVHRVQVRLADDSTFVKDFLSRRTARKCVRDLVHAVNRALEGGAQ